MKTGVRSRRQDRAAIILDAANLVLGRGGSRALTIEAVAAEAGLSKGGVLHHYASKDALILALVARKLEDLRTGIALSEAEQASEPAAFPLALVAHARGTYCGEDEFSRALLLASVEYPEALDGYRSLVHDQLRRLAEVETKPGVGAVVLFAILGLFMGRTLGFHELDQAALADMLDALEGIARNSK